MRPPLTNLQRELLDLFAYDLPDADLLAIKRLLARHFAERAVADMDALATERGMTAGDFKRWAEGHERLASGGH